MNKLDIENLPISTGIYKFFDANGTLLYVGKALNLKARISSYFRDAHSDRPHILNMIPLIESVETIVTENDVESLILESNLIKQYQPKFNIRAKDDKSFAWIYISTRDKFPTVKIVRSIKKGEFQKGKLFGPYPDSKSVKRVFEYVRKLFPFCTCTNPTKPCLYFHLDLCPGPYHNKISQEKYAENIKNIMLFLNGKKRGIIKNLKQEMDTYANTQNFEKAALLRDKIDDLEYLSQKITVSPFEDEDEYLSARYEKNQKLLKTLAKELSIEKIKRIECFDISNIQGKFAYGSMSVAIDANLESSEYRIFKINSLKEPNDPQALKEVILRRLKYPKRPDLMLVDGGVSQLSVLKDIVPEEIKVLAISKGKRLKRQGQKQKDEFWFFKEGKYKRLTIKNPYLLLALRDEAHRFAVKYHRKSIIKYSKLSALDEIEGVGAKRRKALLKAFGSLENIKKASLEDIDNIVKNKSVSARIKAQKYS